MLELILISKPVTYGCNLSGLVQVDKIISIIGLWLPDYSGTQMASKEQVARMALLTSFFLLAHGVIMPGPLEGLKAFFPGIASSTAILIPASIVFLTVFLFAAFPDGRFVPHWTRWMVLVAFLTTLYTFYRTSLFGPPPQDFSRLAVLAAGGVTIVLMTAVSISIFYAQVYRYRHVSIPQQRQQTK